MRKFLTIKHWQLFGLLIGIPMIFKLIMLGFIIAGNNPTIMPGFFSIMMILFIGILSGWLYALGANLHKKLPPTAPMNLKRFKVFLFIPVVYMLLNSVFMEDIFSNLSTDKQPNPSIFALLIPLHLFSMFCILCCLYFNAKALKSVELQRRVTFTDFAGEFFLIWFFPFGIWIIQPRINKLFETTHDNGNYETIEGIT